jgi:hypothetical protein
MPECPECSKTFDTEHGLKCHHGAKHDGSYGKTKIECVICGEEKLIPPSKENVENHTCSKECNKKWREKHYSGENNPMYGEERSEEVKKKLREKIDNSGQKNPMYGKTGEENPNYGDNRPEHSKKMSGDRNPMYGKTGLKHPMGGKKGKSHPRWKGLNSRRIPMGEAWEKKRRLVVKQDGECQNCGISREEHKEIYNMDLSVDHIIPRRVFYQAEHLEESNQKNNLIAYCISCHQQIEAKKNEIKYGNLPDNWKELSRNELLSYVL